MANDETTTIDAAASIEGRLAGRDARILGRFKGEIALKGRLTVGAGAHAEARVEAAAAEIAGRFDGELRVESLLLLETARLTGHVDAKSLTIREGAVVNGAVNTGTEPTAPRPVPEPEPRTDSASAPGAGTTVPGSESASGTKA